MPASSASTASSSSSVPVSDASTPRRAEPSQVVPQSVSVSTVSPMSRLHEKPDFVVPVPEEVEEDLDSRVIGEHTSSERDSESDEDGASTIVEIPLTPPVAQTIVAPPPSYNPPPWSPPITSTPSPSSNAFPHSESPNMSVPLHRLPTDPLHSLPPPYLQQIYSRDADEETLPSYSEPQEGNTLACYLFYFGFMFPIFWLFGGLIMFMELKPVEGLESSLGVSEIERTQKLTLLRKTEKKWSVRCWWALGMFIVLLACLIVGLKMTNLI